MNSRDSDSSFPSAKVHVLVAGAAAPWGAVGVSSSVHFEQGRLLSIRLDESQHHQGERDYDVLQLEGGLVDLAVFLDRSQVECLADTLTQFLQTAKLRSQGRRP